MEHALLSEGLLNDARANSNLETLSDPSPLRFSSDGYVDLESYFRFGHQESAKKSGVASE